MPSYLSYKRQIAVFDADDNEIESWITVRGNHIPIKKGQSKEEAVKSFIESKGGKEKGGDYVSAGREKAKREAGHEFKKRSGVGIKFTEYDPDFEVVRKNALANSSVYGGKYTQKSKAEAYKEYKNDTSSKEKMKRANEFVNGTLIDKRNLPAGTKWSPTDIYGNGTGNKKEENSKYNIQHGAKISDIESMINAHADKKAYKSWKEEEEYVAEKLKEEGIYAYGNQIKEAMKNVYGDAYTKERKEENKNIALKANAPVAKTSAERKNGPITLGSAVARTNMKIQSKNNKNWSKKWNTRANKPQTLGETLNNMSELLGLPKKDNK